MLALSSDFFWGCWEFDADDELKVRRLDGSIGYLAQKEEVLGLFTVHLPLPSKFV